MQPLAEEAGRAALEAVARDINELERLCLEIDASINERDWDRLNAALGDSRRVMHSIENNFAEASPFRTEAFEKAVTARLHQIYDYRHVRMQTLRDIHENIGDRLRQLSRWKGYARSVSIGEKTRRTAGLDSRS